MAADTTGKFRKNSNRGKLIAQYPCAFPSIFARKPAQTLRDGGTPSLDLQSSAWP